MSAALPDGGTVTLPQVRLSPDRSSRIYLGMGTGVKRLRGWLGGKPVWVTAAFSTLVFGALGIGMEAVTGRPGVNWTTVIITTVTWAVLWTPYLYWLARQRA